MTIKPLRLPITSLRRAQCRYPVSADDATTHLFCGLKVESEGCVYCATHAALRYDRRPEAVKRAHRERVAIASAMNARGKSLGNRAKDSHQSEAFGRDS